MDALGKEKKILKKIKTLFAECLILALGKDTLYRVPCPGTRQSFFCFFVFGLQIFCAALLKHQELLVTIWGFFCGFLLYLVTLFRLLEFLRKLEI